MARRWIIYDQFCKKTNKVMAEFFSEPNMYWGNVRDVKEYLFFPCSMIKEQWRPCRPCTRFTTYGHWPADPLVPASDVAILAIVCPTIKMVTLSPAGVILLVIFLCYLCYNRKMVSNWVLDFNEGKFIHCRMQLNFWHDGHFQLQEFLKPSRYEPYFPSKVYYFLSLCLQY
jgi:hypothetical protein